MAALAGTVPNRLRHGEPLLTAFLRGSRRFDTVTQTPTWLLTLQTPRSLASLLLFALFQSPTIPRCSATQKGSFSSPISFSRLVRLSLFFLFPTPKSSFPPPVDLVCRLPFQSLVCPREGKEQDGNNNTIKKNSQQ